MLRFAIMLILASLCLHQTIGQNAILEKPVTGHYEKAPIHFILKDIQKRYKVNFYYSNNLKSLDKMVNI